MSSERRSRERMDRGDVAGVFDRNGNLVLDVDKVIIRADEVIVIKNDDHREHHGKSDRGDVEGLQTVMIEETIEKEILGSTNPRSKATECQAPSKNWMVSGI
jgi:hypothetical protein